MARGSPGAFGGDGDQQPVDLGGVLPRLLRRARATGGGRSRCAASICSFCSRRPRRSGSSTTATSSRRCRCSIRCSSGWCCAATGSASGTAAHPARRAGRCGCCSPPRSSSPGFRVGLNVERSNVIDVGYSGVIGAERIVHGQAPWGNFPVEKTAPNGKALKACGPADSSGEIRDWIQTNGRCESANPGGRHVRAGRVRVVHPGLRRARLEREVGRPAGRRTSRRSRSTC